MKWFAKHKLRKELSAGDYVIVPQADIDAVEKARKAFHKLYVDNDTVHPCMGLEVSQPMYRLCYRKNYKLKDVI